MEVMKFLFYLYTHTRSRVYIDIDMYFEHVTRKNSAQDHLAMQQPLLYNFTSSHLISTLPTYAYNATPLNPPSQQTYGLNPLDSSAISLIASPSPPAPAPGLLPNSPSNPPTLLSPPGLLAAIAALLCSRCCLSA